MAIKNRYPFERVIQSTIDRSKEYLLLTAAIVVLGTVFTVLSPAFFTPNNIINIVRQTATVLVIALGMTYVIISAEIDVSVGGVMAISAVLGALAINTYGAVAGVLVALGVGLGFGMLNGYITVTYGIPSFIVTIGMLGVARGAAFITSGSSPILVDNNTFSAIFGGSIGPIPTMVIWALVLTAVAVVFLSKTRFGRHVYATGDSRQAAEYSGIDTNKVKILTLSLVGLCAAIAGLLYLGRLGVARPGMGSGIELAVIAAVIIGGTSLFGGRGTILGTFLGAILISVIDNGIILLGYGQSWQELIRGIVIIIAVAIRSRDETGEWL